MNRAEMKAALAETEGGTPAQMADAIAVPRHGGFKRALAELVDEGVFLTGGSTRDRVYFKPGAEPPPPPPPEPLSETDQKLMDAVPCTASDFSAVGHALGLYGKDLGARKLALGIETYKDGKRWHCRHVPGYRPLPLERPTSVEFPAMAVAAQARSNEVSKGNIGGRG